MDYLELPPPPPLGAIVRCFWFLRDDAPPAGVQPVVPDGRLEIVLHLAEPFALLGEDRAVEQDDVMISGQLTGPIHLAPRGPADIVGIRFRTAGAAALLRGGLPALTNRIIPLTDISRTLATALRDAAARDATPRERAVALARVLVTQLGKDRDPIAAWSVAGLARATTGSPVEDLARACGLSARTIERRVREAVGVSPREIRAIMRFRRAFAMLDRAPAGRWTGVALAAGYYDQAHLLRDFRRFAGVAPSRFFAGRPDLARQIMATAEDAA